MAAAELHVLSSADADKFGNPSLRKPVEHAMDARGLQRRAPSHFGRSHGRIEATQYS
jgi:hypothetical protein